jgi:hypothetical protein
MEYYHEFCNLDPLDPFVLQNIVRAQIKAGEEGRLKKFPKLS